MSKKIRLLFVLVLVAGLFITSAGSAAAKSLASLQVDPGSFAKFNDPYPRDFQAKPPPAPVIPVVKPIVESLFKEQLAPRCDFTGELNDNPPDKETCEFGDDSIVSKGLPADVSVVTSPYIGDLPNPMNGMPRLGQALGVEFFSEGSVGGVSVCFLVPEGKKGNISFWDVSQVPNVEKELQTWFYDSGRTACALATQTGVFSLVEDLSF